MGQIITGKLSIHSGAVLLPGLSYLLDDTTGFYFVTPGILAAAVAGVRAISVTADNTVVGHAALVTLTTGLHNTAFGVSALRNTTSGLNNTAYGKKTLELNVTGSYNTACGTYALLNSRGSYNTATGSDTLFNNNDGADNAAYGAGALFQNTTGSRNTGNGTSALSANISGSSNTALGYRSLYNSSGSNNTAVGNLSGSGITTGSGNTILGANVVGLDAALLNNVILADGTGSIRARYDAGVWTLSSQIHLAPPTPVGATVTPVGATGVTVYGYRISAINAVGETLACATISTNLGNVTLSATNYNRVGWPSVDGATGYRVYGRTSGSELLITTVTALLYDDTGALTPAGALPTVSTAQVFKVSAVGAISATGGLRVLEAANSKQGIATLIAGTVTIANTSITALSRIIVTAQEGGLLTGIVRVSARTVGTSFVISSSVATDTADIAYQIFEPA